MAGRFLCLQRARRSPVPLLLLHPSFPNPTPPLPPPAPPPPSSAVLCKALNQRPACGFHNRMKSIHFVGFNNIHASRQLNNIDQNVLEPENDTGNVISVDVNDNDKIKRKKLKGKRAVVKWLKHFRWKKKKDYERMTAEEKILFKLRKALKKEERNVEALKKIEPSVSSEAKHDPEILTPEEHFYFLKMGQKCKNYVPVGRRGIFQGVILNMHLHWKKHQTLKVIVKTFTPEEVREIALELARLSGGIVLKIDEENSIIMYRGKNYSQPPTEIMSPKVTLTRKKALDKSKYRDSLRAVRKFITKLHQDLEDLQVQMKREREDEVKTVTKEETTDTEHNKMISIDRLDNFEGFEESDDRSNILDKNVPSTQSDSLSESEDLSDIFETDSDGETEKKVDRPLYLDQIKMFPSEDDDEETENFQEHLRQISAASKRSDSSRKDVTSADLDEIDKIFLRAGSLLKKKRR